MNVLGVYSELAAHWQSVIENAQGAEALTNAWEYISVGADLRGGNKAIEPGDLFKVDVSCLMDGSTSDMSRTFVFDSPGQLQVDLFSALMAGIETGVSLIRPGVALCEVHAATLQLIRAASSPVIPFECPWYINGLRGMIMESQLLITEDGHEMMNTLPLALTEIRP